MHQVIALFAARTSSADAGSQGTTVVEFRTGQNMDALLPLLRRLIEDVPR